jgi:hypothetical protein
MASEPRVRGIFVVRQRDIMRTLAGPRFEGALATVSQAARDDYESTTILSWCPQSSARAVTAAVAEALGRDPVEFVGAVVSQSLREALAGPWAVFLGSMTDDEAILRRAATLFEKSFDQGKLEAVALGKGRFKVTLSGWQRPHAMDVESLARGITTLLEVVERPATVSAAVRADMTVEFRVTMRSAPALEG